MEEVTSLGQFTRSLQWGFTQGVLLGEPGSKASKLGTGSKDVLSNCTTVVIPTQAEACTVILLHQSIIYPRWVEEGVVIFWTCLGEMAPKSQEQAL